MKFFTLGCIFGLAVALIARHCLVIPTWAQFRTAVYFSLFCWLLWNVSVLLRARARTGRKS